MLKAEYKDDGVQLVGSGGLDGTAAVQQLQLSLVNLAQATNWPAANPGLVTGDMNPQTVRAVGAVIGKLTGKMDRKIQGRIQAATSSAGRNTRALTRAQLEIARYASYLSAALRAVSMNYMHGMKQPGAISPPVLGDGEEGFFRLRNPWMWASLGAGAAVLGGGYYYWSR